MSSNALGLVAVAGLIILSTVLGLWLRQRNGRSRSVDVSSPRLTDLLPDRATDGVTVLQVSAEVCGPCRAAARTWRAVVPEGRHIELDVEKEMGIAQALNVWRTPTSFVFNDGVLVRRVDGVPTPAQARDIVADAATGVVDADSGANSGADSGRRLTLFRLIQHVCL